MIHGYHVIMPTYGFWLPNDPRGSWSEIVRKWELLKYGSATRTDHRKPLIELTPHEIAQRDAARAALQYQPVTLTGEQALAVGGGFREQAMKSGYKIWACAILPEHTHLVLGRHSYKVEQMVNLLKGSATRALVKQLLHPLAECAADGGRPPRMWAEHQWKVYLDSEEAIESAIHYVEQNPVREGKPLQQWSFVEPFDGLPMGKVSYHE